MANELDEIPVEFNDLSDLGVTLDIVIADDSPNELDEGIEESNNGLSLVIEDNRPIILEDVKRYEHGLNNNVDKMILSAESYASTGLILMAEKILKNARQYALVHRIDVSFKSAEIINQGYINAMHNSMNFASHFARQGLTDETKIFLEEAKAHAANALMETRWMMELDASFEEIMLESYVQCLNGSLSHAKKLRLKGNFNGAEKELEKAKSCMQYVLSIADKTKELLNSEELLLDTAQERHNENLPVLAVKSVAMPEKARKNHFMPLEDAIKKAREYSQKGLVKFVESYIGIAQTASKETGKTIEDNLEDILANAYRRGKKISLLAMNKARIKINIKEANRCLIEAVQYAEKEGHPIDDETFKGYVRSIAESALSYAESHAVHKKYKESAKLLKEARLFARDKGVNVTDRARNLHLILSKKGHKL